jgi:hypothetical protein
LRFGCELWADDLLAWVMPTSVALQFCFEKPRVKQRVQHITRWGRSPRAHDTWQAQLASLHYALAQPPLMPPVCAELNADLCGLILGCLPPCVFDGSGVPRPGWALDSFASDDLSLNILVELCGSAAFPLHMPGGR